MADGNPALTAALMLSHIEAGIENLEVLKLDAVDRVEATRLAWRLAALSTIRER